MSQVTHWTPLKAQADISARRIVEVIGADDAAQQAAANNDALVGVSGSRAVETDETVEVAISGIAEVEYGANVTRGALLTSDASGKAVATSTAGHRVVGIAMWSGADGDIGRVLISPGSV